jgi:hypothetical protein
MFTNITGIQPLDVIKYSPSCCENKKYPHIHTCSLKKIIVREAAVGPRQNKLKGTVNGGDSKTVARGRKQKACLLK